MIENQEKWIAIFSHYKNTIHNIEEEMEAVKQECDVRLVEAVEDMIKNLKTARLISEVVALDLKGKLNR